MKQRIPFVGPSYEGRNADRQRTLNCYLEMDNSSPRAPIALIGTPGMTYLGTIGNGPIRAMLRENNYVYVVSKQDVYRLGFFPGFGYGAVFLGIVTTTSGPIGIASNGTQILIVDGVLGWIVDITTQIMSLITDVDFPEGVNSASYQDGYFIVTGDTSQKFYINETPGDGTVWNGLDFASAEGSPDKCIKVISDHRELWLFGDKSVEVWTNTGNANFPFERSGNAFIEHGCAAAASVAKLDNTLFWLGTDDQGAGLVWKVQGYTPTRISTHAIEKALQSYTTTADALGWAYQQEGHSFYVLSFPTANKTWVYDVSTGQWHERCWRNPSDGSENMWRASCHVFWNFDHLVGDYQNGNFYKLQLDSNLDSSNPIKRLRISQTSENLQNEVFYSFLQIDMETGYGGDLSLRYSDDDGHTWSGSRTISTGAVGDYAARAIYRRLGKGRNRVWEISTASNAKFVIRGAVADIEPGVS